ncbi:cysteine-rich receptor-like protein kinase 25 [Quercus suber]|uniref:Cysteine-rich receptor-like protein kinase 25 n=1 Tax=Quercus suber TaxID=58331 RepID=A0AAW0JIU1_QUESU
MADLKIPTSLLLLLSLLNLFSRSEAAPTFTDHYCSNSSFFTKNNIRNHCPLDKVILIWYDECTICYTNQSDLNNLVPSVNFNTTAQNFTSGCKFYELGDALLIVLESAVGSLPMYCTGKEGGTVVLPSSNIRYELYPFFNYAASSIPLSPLPRGTLYINFFFLPQ